MVVAAALIPAAPLLLRDITPNLADDLAKVRTAVDDVLVPIRDAQVALLLAAGTPGVHTSARVNFAGLGRPDVTIDLPVPVAIVRALTEATGLPRVRGPLPLDLAVLAAHAGVPVVPVAVDAQAAGSDLAALGAAMHTAIVGMDRTVAVLGAGDGSGGLSPKAPRPDAPGAADWQAAYEQAIGEVGALSQLGPEGAAHAFARGWAPSVALSSLCTAAALTLDVTAADAPRGVGYVVARSAPRTS